MHVFTPTRRPRLLAAIVSTPMFCLTESRSISSVVISTSKKQKMHMLCACVCIAFVCFCVKLGQVASCSLRALSLMSPSLSHCIAKDEWDILLVRASAFAVQRMPWYAMYMSSAHVHMLAHHAYHVVLSNHLSLPMPHRGQAERGCQTIDSK